MLNLWITNSTNSLKLDPEHIFVLYLIFHFLQMNYLDWFFMSNFSGYSTIAQTGLLSLILLCSLPVLTGLNWTPTTFYISGFAIVGFLTLPILWIKLNSNPVFWLINSIFSSENRLKLVSIWSFCILIAIAVVLKQVWKLIKLLPSALLLL